MPFENAQDYGFHAKKSKAKEFHGSWMTIIGRNETYMQAANNV